MRLITSDTAAIEAIENFADQYGPEFPIHLFGDTKEIYGRLKGLGDKPTAKQVNSIIPGWASVYCHECDKEVDAVVQIGQEPDYESATASVCQGCLSNAVWSFV